jgi:L-ascorbate metabolism protein UlaG (beta-lactamase superfamily)
VKSQPDRTPGLAGQPDRTPGLAGQPDRTSGLAGKIIILNVFIRPLIRRPGWRDKMKIKWFGHSAFVINSQTGKIFITDPYEAGGYNGAIGYVPINITADIVTISHDHADHNYIKTIQGNPKILNRTGDYEVGGIKIKGIPVYHDTKQGKERGNNIIFVYEIDGLRVVHLGDLGHLLSAKQIDELGNIDILLIPVGGYFTIDPKQATDIVNTLKPKITIPMHYKTEVLNFPVAKVEEFLRGKKSVKKVSSVEVSITKENLPVEPEIWVLQYVK